MIIQSQSPSDTPIIAASPGAAELQLEHGFLRARTETVAELSARVSEYRHLKTGAQVLVVHNDDPNMCLAVSFRTAIGHSKGIAHIGEHLIFRGSEKFTGTDPINSYLQESLSSVSNAATSYDFTTYYFGSPHPRDFQNQRDLLIDAVFAPRLGDAAFRQEAWRVEKTASGELSLNGIVLNEMRGYSSDPREVYNCASTAALFPDTHYRFNYGGDPSVIPQLSPDELREFIRHHNHPSNARVILYGAIDPSQELKALAERFDQFSARDVLTPAPFQPYFSEPVRTVAHYPGAETEDAARDSVVGITWRLGRSSEIPNQFTLRVLQDLILCEHPGTVREKLDSLELGEQILTSGFDESLRESTFSVVVTGTAASRTAEIETAILTEMRAKANGHFSPETIANSIRRVKAQFVRWAEAADRGESVLGDIETAWNQEQDPVARLRWRTDLSKLEQQLETNPRYFEGLIKYLLLQNPHRVTLTVKPDRKLNEAWTAADSARAHELGETPVAQEPASKEEPKTPKLKLADLASAGISVPREFDDGIWGYPVPHRETFSAQLAVSFNHVPQELLPYVQVLGLSLSELGRESQRGNFEDLEANYFIVATQGGANVGRLMLMANGFRQDSRELLETVARQFEIDPTRHRQELIRILIEQKAGMEDLIQGDGQLHCRIHAAGKHHPIDTVLDSVAGIGSLDLLRSSINEAKHHWRDFSEKLARTRELILKHSDPMWALIGDPRDIEANRASAHELAGKFGPMPGDQAAWTTGNAPMREGFSAPSQVTSSAVGFDLRSAGYAHHGSIEVLLKLIEHGRMWPVVRQSNGAYSPRVNFNSDTGILTIGAGSDSRPHETIQAAEGIADWLDEIAPKIKELRRAKIGAIGECDKPQSAAANAEDDFLDRLRGYPLDKRKQLRAEIFETNADHCRQLAAAIARAQTAPLSVSVIGSRKELQALNKKRGDDFLQIRRLE